MVSAGRVQTLLTCAKAQERRAMLPDGFSVGCFQLVTRLGYCIQLTIIHNQNSISAVAVPNGINAYPIILTAGVKQLKTHICCLFPISMLIIPLLVCCGQLTICTSKEKHVCFLLSRGVCIWDHHRYKDGGCNFKWRK